MDATHFDTVTRALVTGASRRRLAILLAALGLSTAGVRLGVGDTTAKHRKKKKKKGRGSPPASPPPASPPSACVPEPQVTTCGGNCATKTNNCGQIVTCPCLGTKQCLSNGSCAQVCEGAEGCPSGCGCSDESMEVVQRCIDTSVSGCNPPVQACTSTAQCPIGQHCQETPCGVPTYRCVPLCPR
jgi:hypothetical protein